MIEQPKCECGNTFGLSVFDGKWWCPKCLWKEITYLRNAIQKHRNNFPDEPLDGEKELWAHIQNH